MNPLLNAPLVPFPEDQEGESGRVLSKLQGHSAHAETNLSQALRLTLSPSAWDIRKRMSAARAVPLNFFQMAKCQRTGASLTGFSRGTLASRTVAQTTSTLVKKETS